MTIGQEFITLFRFLIILSYRSKWLLISLGWFFITCITAYFHTNLVLVPYLYLILINTYLFSKLRYKNFKNFCQIVGITNFKFQTMLIVYVFLLVYVQTEIIISIAS
jgi:hypothetical protein